MKKAFFTSVLALLAATSAWAQNSFTVNGLNGNRRWHRKGENNRLYH